MTINIGINLGEYVILAADTRTNYMIGNDTIVYEDEHEKILKTKIGLITGSGYVSLLNDVKNELKRNEVEHTNEIVEIIKRNREKHINQSKTNPYIFGDIQKTLQESTCWLFTYITAIDNFPTLRLSLVHPQFNDVIALYEKNKTCVIMPMESSKDECERIGSKLNADIEQFEDTGKIHENIQDYIKILSSLIKLVSQKYESVSPSFQIGIHTLDGKTGISSVVENASFSITLS